MKDDITIIGTGVIGRAIVDSLLKSKYDGKIIATEIDLEKIRDLKEQGVAITRENKKAVKASEVIFLCVKPNAVEGVLKEVSVELEGKMLIYTAATVPLKFCKRMVPKAKFVRTMPNVAILVQEAFIAYCCDEDVTQEDKEKAKEILGVMGIHMEVKERYMDAITALSGSGPGYISIIIEALMYAGLKVGLPRDLALYSSAQSVLGTAKLMLETGKHPAQIRDMVTTPGGTTIEAIYELEGGQIRQGLMRAVEAATRKSEKIRKKWGIDGA